MRLTGALLMRNRSRAREVALQLLFQRDHNTTMDSAAAERFILARLREEAIQAFCRTLYEGVVQHGEDIDRRLADAAENWRLSRMATVDRNVLRLGAYELLFHGETPASVVLDEAIELARRYGSAESPAFVNGILDRVRQAPESAEPSPPSEEPAPPA